MADESEDFEKQISDAQPKMECEGGGSEEEVNQGWADAMARILENQLPEDKPPVLLKYKKIEKRKAERNEQLASKKLKSQERHAMLEKDHIKPDASTLDYEKNLMRIATRGVVKLFNAVSKHQKEINSKLNSAPTEAKKTKVETMSKSTFLDMLKSSSDKGRTQENKEQKGTGIELTDTDDASSWSILRDDFMMGAKMKDWNREEQKTKRKDKKLTDITDHELETSNADFFDESDDGNNEQSDSESDMDSQGG